MAVPKAHFGLEIGLNRIVHEAQLRCCWGAGGALTAIFRLSQDKTASSLHPPARQALRDKPG